jgi:hypothetical protein
MRRPTWQCSTWSTQRLGAPTNVWVFTPCWLFHYYGEEQPLDPAENESAWANNRRDEFRVSSGRLARQ